MALQVGVNSYADVGDSITYFLDTLRSSRWTAVDVNTKSAALIDATRYLDRLNWIGTKTSSAQPLAWPRSGVVDKEGNVVDGGTVPSFIKEATYEVALRLAEDPSIIDNFSNQTGDNTKRVKAGDVEAEFFRPVEGSPVFDWLLPLLSHYLGGSTILGGFASGIDGTSEFISGRYDKTDGFA